MSARTNRMLAFAALFAVLPGCVVNGSGVSKTEGRPISDFDGIKSTAMVDVEIRQSARVDGIDLTCDDNLLDIIETKVKDGQLVVGLPVGVNALSHTPCKLVTGNTQLYDVVSTGSGDITLNGPAWSLEHVRSTGSGDVKVTLRGEFEGQTGEDLVDDTDESGGLTEAPEEEGSLTEGQEDSEAFVLEALPAAVRMDIETTGSGDVRIDGLDLDKVFLTTTGSGDVSLEGDANKLDAKSTGSGDVRTKALHVHRVDVLTTGSGDMTAWADKSATAKSTGSGDITIYGNPDSRSRNSTGSGDIRFR